jgi:hypothetical protein
VPCGGHLGCLFIAFSDKLWPPEREDQMIKPDLMAIGRKNIAGVETHIALT